MQKLKTTKRAAALLLCAALLCVPLLGLAAPAQAGPLEPSVSGNVSPVEGNTPAPEESTPATEESASTPEESAPHESSAPETEAPPTSEPAACVCETRCAAGTGNPACAVCLADPAACTGKEPPVCACTVKCTAGTGNPGCLVCMADLTGCKAPEPTPPPTPSYTITIVSPSGWYTKSAQVEIRLADDNGTGWKKVEAKIERGGSWQDLTDDFADGSRATVEITENCTVYVTVTDKEGKAHTKSRYIECFDRTAPTVKAGTSGRLLRVEAEDEHSGIDAIYIDGERYDDLTNGTLDVRLRDLDDDYKQISVQAVDYAGNKSRTVQLTNPNYEEPTTDKNGEKQPSSSCPEPATPEPITPAPTPTTTPAATPGGTVKPGTGTAGGSTAASAKQTGTAKTSGDKEEAPAEKEPGEPLTEGSGIVTRDLLYDKATNKQFITVQGRGGSTFYIVIDYDAPVNEEEEQYTTYFLNQVDEADLAALLEEPEPASCDCKEKCAAGAVNTACPVCASNMTECAGNAPEPEKPKETETPKPTPEEPEKKDGAGGALALLVVLILAGGGAFYYIRFVKNKPKTRGNTSLEDYDYGDGDLDFEDDAPEGEEPDGPETPEEGGEPADGEDEGL